MAPDTDAPPRAEHGQVEGVEPPPGRNWAWRQRLRANRHTHLTLRIVVGLLGTLLILAGAITGPLPGPGGIPLVLLGIAVWSSEFAWAHRVMRRFRQLVRWIGGWRRRTKVLALAGVVILGWTSLYVWLRLNGVPQWLPLWLETTLHHLPGLAPS